MKFLKTLICIMTFLLGTQRVYAERVEYGPRPVSVTIPFVDSDRDLVADSITFVFPKSVKSINNKSKFLIAPEDKNDPNYSRLSITPMVKSGQQKVLFTLVDGQVIKVKAKIISNAKYAVEEYQFVPKQTLGAKRIKGKLKVTDLEVMGSLIAGAHLLGFKEKKIRRQIRCGYWGLKAYVEKVYEGSGTKAYVIQMTNTSRKYEYALQLPKVFFEGQDLNRSVISHSTNYKLVPKKYGSNKATLKIVADGNVHIKKAHICKKGEQVVQKTYLKPKPKGKKL